MKKEPLLNLDQISFSLPGRERAILKNISLKLYPGDFLVVLGGNGSGKSSLIKCTNGLYQPQQGTISLSGAESARHSRKTGAQEISTLTQDLTFSTFYEMTVFENCVCAALKTGLFPDKDSVKKHLKKFHERLPDKLDERASSLSGGERQCLALAMCLYSTPKLLLLDEHTSALDPKMGRQTMEITRSQICLHPGLSVMMTTHNLDDALQYGNRLIVLDQGEIAFEAAGERKKELTKPQLLAFY